MNFIETSFKINSDSRVASMIGGRRFRSDKDFIETLEDLFFGQSMKKGDIGDFVSKENIFNTLDENIGN